MEFCSLCPDWPCQRYVQEQADSFIPHRNARRDLETVKRVGLEHYRETLGKKMEGLRFLLERCNDGRRKSLFCTAVNLLELEDVEAVIARLEGGVRPRVSPGGAEGPGSRAAELFRERAQTRGVSPEAGAAAEALNWKERGKGGERPMNIQWEAGKYTENFDFVHRYGESVLELVEAEAGGLVVDLGCGNGALTQKLADRGYRVLGVDDSCRDGGRGPGPSSRTALPKGDAVTFQLEEKADVIFSNAVLHWIDGSRQQALARNVAAQLKPGGQFIFEFGGKGCAERSTRRWSGSSRGRGLAYPRTFYFPTIGSTLPFWSGRASGWNTRCCLTGPQSRRRGTAWPTGSACSSKNPLRGWSLPWG